MAISADNQISSRANMAMSSEGFVARTLVIAFAVCLLMCLLPATAYAKSYECPQVTITADAQSDGSLRVVEQRTFDFDGSFTCVWWNIGRDFKVNGVQIGELNDQGSVDFRALPEVGFETGWREEGGPGTFSWSRDIVKNDLYVFFKEKDTTVVVSVDYTVTWGVIPYKDCAEVYWSFVGTGWDVASQNVTCTITLPVPADATPIPGDNVRAWGHGPLSGSLEFNDAGNVVTYTVDKVPAGRYSDARVVFPRSWLSNVSAEQLEAHGNENHIDDVLAEEKEWADSANWQRRWQALFYIGFGLLIVSFVVAALIIWLRRGRDYKPAFNEAYWRSEPAPGIHPCMVARLMRSNAPERHDDVTPAVLHAVNKGAIYVGRSSYDVPGSEEPAWDYYLARTDDPNVTLDAIDTATLHLLFDVIGRGAPSIWVGDIQRFAKKNPDAFGGALKDWQSVLTGQVERAGYFEKQGSRWQAIMLLASCVLFFLTVLVGIFAEDPWILLLGLIATGALFAISMIMPRRSREGEEIFARAKGLRRWLLEFAQTGEPPSESIRYWADMAVYATIFGIAENLMDQLHRSMPRLFAMPAQPTSDGSFNVPWWAIYDTRGASSSAFSTPLSESFASSWNKAHSALVSSSSSSSGGGGGFSGGGGGGFGGGGGAR